MIDSFIEGNKIFLEKDFERKKRALYAAYDFTAPDRSLDWMF